MVNKHLRLFTAIPVPAAIGRQLVQALPFPIGRNLHMTLSFIGNAADSVPFLEALRSVRSPAFLVRTTAPLPLKKGLLALAADPAPDLLYLKNSIDLALKTTGFVPESRPYLPHITLTRRLKTTSPSAECPAFSFPAEYFCLYQSILRPEGAEHKILGRFELLKADGGRS